MLASLVLFLISVATGIGLLWVFRRTSDQAAIRATKKRLQARLLELRLYADDPRVVLAAQKALLVENLRYFALMLRPALYATVPVVILLIALDGFYGRRPLAPGETAVLTAVLDGQAAPDEPVSLEAPTGIAVETPAVHALARREVSWRIRAEEPVAGQLRLTSEGETVLMPVVAGEGLHCCLYGRRVRSRLAWLLAPGAAPLDARWVKEIKLDYPAAEVSYFGLRTHWLVWFLVFSMAAAFLLKGRFRVTV